MHTGHHSENEPGAPKSPSGGEPEKRFSLTGIFRKAAAHIGRRQLPYAIGATAGLLATTALFPAILATTFGASLVIGASLAALHPAGGAVVGNALAFGKKTKIDALKLGMIIGGLNTIPELAVSLGSMAQGTPDLGIAHVVGSSIIHTLPILGMTAILAGSFKSKAISWKFNTLALMGATVAFGSQLAMGKMVPAIGWGMFGLAGYYLYSRYKPHKDAEGHETQREPGACCHHDHDHEPGVDKEHEHHDHEPEHGHKHDDKHHHDHKHDHDHHGHHEHDHEHDHEHCHGHDHSDPLHIHSSYTPSETAWKNAAWGIAAMLTLVGASHLLVDATTPFTGRSRTVLGALLAALFTSLPEGMENYHAAKAKQTDLAVGNVMGCNLTSTLIAGGAASVMGLSVPASVNPETTMGLLQTGAYIGSAGLMTAALLANKGGLKKWHGYTAVGLYVAYAAAAMGLNSGVLPDLHGGHTPEPIPVEQPALPQPQPENAQDTVAVVFQPFHRQELAGGPS